MKTLRKLLAGSILVALTVFGLTALTSSSTDSADPPVWGFTDRSCQSEDYKWFENLGALIAADGKKDPDATGEDADKIWHWRSYIEDGDHSHTCHLVEYEEVVVIGVVPKGSIIPAPAPGTYGGGGGGGGGGGEARTPAQKQADEFTKEKLDELKECWEEKADTVTKKIKGWNPDAIGATEVTWAVQHGEDQFGLAFHDARVLNDELLIDVTIYPHGIAAWLTPTAATETFDHVATFGQIHETFHIGQFKARFDATGSLPKPYEYWDLEVQAHKGSVTLWQTLYDKKKDAGVPSLLLDVNAEKTKEYQKMEDDYKDLVAKLEQGPLTDADAAKMERLAKDLKNPGNLPQASANTNYEPSKLKNFECD